MEQLINSRPKFNSVAIQQFREYPDYYFSF